MESSLTVLRGERVERLRTTNCVFVAPGVESWTDYSNKAGVGRKSGLEKVHGVVEQFQKLDAKVPYLQANFMFGLDTDRGDAPVELTKLFMDQTPFVWPAVNIPVPFGGTPLHQELLRTDRILKTMPFGFYYAPYLVTRLQNYDPVTYYQKLIELSCHAASPAMLTRRMNSTSHRTVKLLHLARTAGTRTNLKHYRQIHALLRSDSQFRAFHDGESAVLPDYYTHRYKRLLKGYGELLSPADRVPNLTQSPESDT